MILIASLIGIPIVTALLLFVARNNAVRNVVVIAASVLLAVLALVLTLQYLLTPVNFVLADAAILSHLALVIELACCVFIIYRAARASNFLVIILAGIQGILAVVYDLSFEFAPAVSGDLYIDQLTIIMVLVIALIGGGINLFALGYMQDYQAHREDEGARMTASGDPSRIAEAVAFVRDRRHAFFAVMFLFLGGMFALVFSNRLSWFLAAWEITTLCSFILIGFTQTKEAKANAFKAVAINLAGGLALTIAFIMVAANGAGIFELDVFVAAALQENLVLPVVLVAFAGMTKAAQMPFQGWLLGAMVAPTPVSAMLHSSTMVKAGVFLIIKFAPAFGWNIPGLFVLIVGGLTFLICSAFAIAQNNSKRVLAYSTVANLGLIVTCAGIGTPEAIWAAIFLLVFHAVAKALLFCCVGTAEHHLGSRDIESMDDIFVRMPWLASALALGMMAMFIAPFGMLVGKWAALVSIAESGHFELLFVLAFGSALTFVFWAKWLGKTLAVGSSNKKSTGKVTRFESVALSFLAFLLIAVTLSMPYLSGAMVMPYLQLTGFIYELPSWLGASESLSYDNLVILSIVFIAFLLLVVVQILRRKPESNDTVYLAGVGINSDARDFSGSLGESVTATQRNWYLSDLFGEKVLGRKANVLVGAVIGLFFILGIVAEVMFL